MNTDMKYQLHSRSSGETEAIAEAIGKELRGGEVLELVSDLGGGKTTFTRGLARGAGSTDSVASPTFTISREYTTPKLTIHHFDFYRLTEAGLMAQELSEILTDRRSVSVVEWAGAVHDVLPEKRLTIHLAHGAETDRKLKITCPEEYQYLLTGLSDRFNA